MNIISSDRPLVSFLTVNFHQAETTKAMVNSLKNLTYPNWECVVVNNHEMDEELQCAFSNDDRIKIIATNSNLGFAGGNNAGLPYCNGEYVYFINNDTEVFPDLLESVVQLFESNPKVGMISSKIIFYHDKKTLQYAGATEMNKITIRNSSIGFGEEDRGQYNEVRKTAFVHGASMVVPRKLIDQVGMMHDDYFLYYEEYDWCERFKKAGYDIYYCGVSGLYHKESISTGVNSPLKVYYLTRNRLLFAKRNYSKLIFTFNFLFFTMLALPKGLLKHLVNGEIPQFKAMLKGYFWNLNSTNSDYRI